MLKIRRNDEVVVIAGKDKGKRGKVQKVLADGLKTRLGRWYQSTSAPPRFNTGRT